MAERLSVGYQLVVRAESPPQPQTSRLGLCFLWDQWVWQQRLEGNLKIQHNLHQQWLWGNGGRLLLITMYSPQSLHRWGISHSESMERLAYSQGESCTSLLGRILLTWMDWIITSSDVLFRWLYDSFHLCHLSFINALPWNVFCLVSFIHSLCLKNRLSTYCTTCIYTLLH